jgi:putative hydrolase of HD superfamily
LSRRAYFPEGCADLIREGFLRFIYEGASMQRWNDHIRPHKGFTELDKQSHKLFFAYVIGRLEEDEGTPINWTGLIEGGIFEFFQRTMLTDIKPPIFHKLMERHGDQLNRLVLDRLREKGVYDIEEGLEGRIERYYSDGSYCSHEKRILKASHYLATNWEFDIVYRLSSNFFGLEETKRGIERQIEEHRDINGVQKLIFNKNAKDFLNLIGQLRFQQRWAQTPRLPETSVAGHMLIVAVLSYMLSLEIGACGRRKYNNFFAGLFHDLPEVLTRDIISPVKNSIGGLGELIKAIEDGQMEEVIYPLLPAGWDGEIRYFTENEFSSKIIKDGGIVETTSDEINERYNDDLFSPVDGSIIEFCDKLAAYLEAWLSIKHGISSRNLLDGHRQLYDKYRDHKAAGLDTGMLFDYFRL